MYPVIRMIKGLWAVRNAPPLGLYDSCVTHHICWPWDIDMWMELNNGRTLTLYDLGRIPLASRVGLVTLLRKKGWGLTMAGVSVRYRRRIRTFDRFEIRSRCVGWDDKFVYLEQGMWRNGECANHALYRSAVTDKKGIVAPELVLAELDRPAEQRPLPDWVQAWIAADAERPWPPEM